MASSKASPSKGHVAAMNGGDGEAVANEENGDADAEE
jgi:hypothetical protein